MRRARGRAEERVKGDAEHPTERTSRERTVRKIKKEREDEWPEGRSRTNDGIVTRLWMGASMKPMVCKTPRESACWRGQKGNGRSTLEIARAGSIPTKEEERKNVYVCMCVWVCETERAREFNEGREQGSRECVVINEFRAGDSAA